MIALLAALGGVRETSTHLGQPDIPMYQQEAWILNNIHNIWPGDPLYYNSLQLCPPEHPHHCEHLCVFSRAHFFETEILCVCHSGFVASPLDPTKCVHVPTVQPTPAPTQSPTALKSLNKGVGGGTTTVPSATPTGDWCILVGVFILFFVCAIVSFTNYVHVKAGFDMVLGLILTFFLLLWS